MNRRIHLLVAATSILSMVLLAGCRHESNNFIYMPDMVWGPAVKAQGGQARVPVKGTIPRDFSPYPYPPTGGDQAGRELRNPLVATRPVLLRGQAIYNTYCIVCHGAAGLGDGSIVPKFPRPPSLHSDKVRNWPDGNIYHVISNGQNLMPSYASQINQADRWAVIHYVRVLQRSQHPTPEDLKAAEQAKQGQ